MDLEHEYLRNARRKLREARSYFDDDDDDASLARERTESSSHGLSNDVSTASNGPVEAEIDPLDAFMAGITAQVKQEQTVTHAAKRSIEKPARFEDDETTYMDDLARPHKKPRAGGSGNGDGDPFADSDDEVYATARQVDGDSDHDHDHNDSDLKKEIEALAPLDHCGIVYETFRKQFYTPHAAIAGMSEADVRELRHELAIATDGSNVPRPIRSFVQVGFDRKMLAVLMKLGLEAPTPIQAQAFPIAMSGRDMIGIAKTGSGKTLAFTLPMVVHVMDQRELRKDEGPIAIVLSPTRELAHQIVGQVKKFLTVYGAHCAAIYGGVGKWDQIQALRKGAEVVVATPGRLIDMIRKKNVKTKRVTFVVLDEADRMFEMGFEPQLRSIMGQIRPDRQTLMFSATFRKRVESLARDVLHDPVKITVGQIGQANEDIHQIAILVPNHNAKWPWLMANLKRIAGEGRVLIFAGSKTGCEEMTKNLNALNYASNCLHGDKNQQERNEALAKFRSGACSILVATDVASRGLDVKDVKSVINFDVAKNIDTHVHRIGRTGRMGAEGFEPGTAYTLVTKNDSQIAAQLVYNMDVSGQAVAADLIALARRDPRFRRGTPANGSHGSTATTSTSDLGRSHALSRQNAFDPVDEEDEVELKRWNENQKKTKAEQRKGLGFAAGLAGSNGGVRMSFVKPSSAGSLQQAFQTGFVKASTPAEPTQPPVPPVQPPRLPPPPGQALQRLQPPGQSTTPPAFRPPPLPPAIIQAAALPPHVAHFQPTGLKKHAPSITVPPPPPAAVIAVPPPQATECRVNPNDAPMATPPNTRRQTDSSDHDRSPRARRRSRSRSHTSSSSRGRRYERRSRSRSRDRRSDRRYRSRSRSRSRSSDRYSRHDRSRSRSRGSSRR